MGAPSTSVNSIQTSVSRKFWILVKSKQESNWPHHDLWHISAKKRQVLELSIFPMTDLVRSQESQLLNGASQHCAVWMARWCSRQGKSGLGSFQKVGTNPWTNFNQSLKIPSSLEWIINLKQIFFPQVKHYTLSSRGQDDGPFLGNFCMAMVNPDNLRTSLSWRLHFRL